MSHDPMDGYIIEFIAMGNQIKVTAIDPVSGKEVSMIGAKQVSKDELSRIAIRKLQYVLERDKDS